MRKEDRKTAHAREHEEIRTNGGPTESDVECLREREREIDKERETIQ